MAVVQNIAFKSKVSTKVQSKTECLFVRDLHLMSILILAMGSLLLETDQMIDKIGSRNVATKLLKASSDETELNAIKERLALMSQSATLHILVLLLFFCVLINLFQKDTYVIVMQVTSTMACVYPYRF